MKSLADALPPEIAQQIDPEWRKNEAAYWALRDQLLSHHRGQWIGFADGAVVASGTSPVGVFHAAEAVARSPFVTCVGREDEPVRMRRVGFAYDGSYPGEMLFRGATGEAVLTDDGCSILLSVQSLQPALRDDRLKRLTRQGNRDGGRLLWPRRNRFRWSTRRWCISTSVPLTRSTIHSFAGRSRSSVKSVSAAKVAAQFDDYLQASREQPVLVTRNGKPVALLMAVRNHAEAEHLARSHRRSLRSILQEGHEQIQQGEGIPHEQFWRELEQSRAAKRKASARGKKA